MEVRIFYSWQSKTDLEFNKKFIEECLKSAIKIIKPKLEIGTEIYLDRDTKDIPGTPNVLLSINQKIEICNIFLCDLSFINNSDYQILNQEELFVSPNVMKEFGQAESSIGTNNIICVSNIAYGKPSEISMPFDIRQYRWPIEYELSKNNIGDKENQKNKLVEKLAEYIKASLEDGIANPQFKHSPFIDWKILGHFNELDYVEDDNLKNIRIEIYKAAIKERNCLRIAGLSGIGKTRLVYECFNPNNSGVDAQFVNKVLYYDLNDTTNHENIFLKITKLSEIPKHKIIILDNCDEILHERFQKIILRRNSKLSLITISYNPITSELKRGSDIFVFDLKPEFFEPIIEKLLFKYFPSELDKDIREKIKIFAKGHTQIASILAQAKIKDGANWKPVITKKEIINKLIEIDIDVTNYKEVLKVISLFDKIGYELEKSNEVDFLIASDYFLKHKIPSINIKNFKEVASKYFKRGIIEKPGRYITVRSKPLALSLALEWWENFDGDPKEFIDSFEGNDELLISLANQLKFLDFAESAQNIIQVLITDKGFFSKAEVLNSELGSRLFRSFVEVNPMASLDGFEKTINLLSKEDLLDYRKGRRNTIWALEKLCFRKETFIKASKLLLKFAIAENEAISNNATGQFLQLFQIYLPGTVANLDERKELLRFIIDKNDDEYLEFGIKGLFRSIQTGNFTRFGGGDKQGFGTVLIDHRPEWNDVIKHIEFCLEQLYTIATIRNEFEDLILEGLINSTRSFYHARIGNMLLPYLQKIMNRNDSFNNSIRKQLLLTIKYHKFEIDQTDVNELTRIIESITDESLTDKYKNCVIELIFDDINEEIDYIEVAKEKCKILAKDFIDSGENLEDYFELFYTGLQHNAFYFGAALGNLLLEKGTIDEFLNQSIKKIEKINSENLNLTLLAGVISVVEPGKKLSNLKLLFSSSVIKSNVFNVAFMVNPDWDILNYLIELMEKDELDAFLLNTSTHTQLIKNLTFDQLNEIVNRLSLIGDEGKYVCVSILFTYGYGNTENQAEGAVLFEKIISDISIKSENNKQKLDIYYWSQLINWVFNNGVNEEFAKILNIKLSEFCDQKGYIGLASGGMYMILEKLIVEYFDITWKYWSELITAPKEEYHKFYNLKTLIGAHIEYNYIPNGLIIKGDFEKIKQWLSLAQNKEFGPSRLIEFLPVFSSKEMNDWHPWTRYIIDEFGNVENVLNSLSSNMGTYGWMGSLVPLLNRKKKLFEQLVNHNFEEVRLWALNNIDYLNDRIKKEKTEDEEDNFER